MNSYPKITVVTPNYNQAQFIEQTINSVLEQNYPNLEYIIIDGGSTDGSLEIIKKYADKLHYWISEKDKGMYDAINKGFSMGNGDIMCWINSDDILLKDSLINVSEIFQKNLDVLWIRGIPTIINEKSKVTWTGQDKPVHSKYFFYLHRYLSTFSFIQQESTFWTRDLWEKVGGQLDESYKLAADFDLWMRFFKYQKIYFTHKKLGAFRKREGQQSENKNLYLQETLKSVKHNQSKLNFKDQSFIIFFKFLRKIIFSSKNKYLKQKYYFLFNNFLGKGNWLD